MSSNVSWDSIEITDLSLPYNKTENELSETQRLVGGKNTYCTLGGKLQKRFGTSALNTSQNFGTNNRTERAIIYETLDSPALLFLVMSMFNPSTGFYEVWHTELNGNPSTPVKSGTYRAMDKSRFPHEFVVARGLLYIKGFPNGNVLDPTVLGSVIFDGTAGTVNIRPWGTLTTQSANGQTYVEVSSAIGNLTIPSAPGMTTTTQVIRFTNIDTKGQTAISGLSGGSFTVVIDQEQMTITAYTQTGGRIDTTAITRGVNGTTATSHNTGSIVHWLYNVGTSIPWTTSDFVFTVNQFWDYEVVGISSSNNYSNRTPSLIPPQFPPNNVNNVSTGFRTTRTPAFFSQIPQIVISNSVWDATNFPQLAILRTTDGGGTFYLLDIITNTGIGNITYTDNIINNNNFSFVSNTTLNGPVPDLYLTGFAPSLTSNSPPPTVTAPKVVGTDTIQRCTPMTYFQGRIWYGVNNVLFFSSQEETTLGVPEECFPSGITGNFFRFKETITNVVSTSESLYVFTLRNIYVFTGSTRDTFSYQPLFDDIGHPPGHPRAAVRYGENVAFLTNDFRIGLLVNNRLTIISDPLKTDIIDAIVTDGGEIDIKYFSQGDKEWIVVGSMVLATPTKSKQWVFDLKKSMGATTFDSPPLGGMYSKNTFFWNTPWNIPMTCMCFGPQAETNRTPSLLTFFYDPTQQNTVVNLLRTLPTSVITTDQTSSAGVLKTTNIDIDMVLNNLLVPRGDHVNVKRAPGLTPVIYNIRLDNTYFTGEDEPIVYYFKDDLATQPLPTTIAEDPPRRPLSVGFKSREYGIFETCQHFAIEITSNNSSSQFELLRIIISYEPDQGA